MLARAAAFAYQKPVIKRLIWRSWYQFLARRYRDGRWTFMNYGYRPPEGTPALTLAPEDEADRSSIQLYHLVANAVDLSGREVLEISTPREIILLDEASCYTEFRRHLIRAIRNTATISGASRYGAGSASACFILCGECAQCFGQCFA